MRYTTDVSIGVRPASTTTANTALREGPKEPIRGDLVTAMQAKKLHSLASRAPVRPLLRLNTSAHHTCPKRTLRQEKRGTLEPFLVRTLIASAYHISNSPRFTTQRSCPVNCNYQPCYKVNKPLLKVQKAHTNKASLAHLIHAGDIQGMLNPTKLYHGKFGDTTGHSPPSISYEQPELARCNSSGRLHGNILMRPPSKPDPFGPDQEYHGPLE